MNNSFNEMDTVRLAEKEAFNKVKEYLRTNPNSNAMQVSMATGVSVAKITKFVREGMLNRSL